MLFVGIWARTNQNTQKCGKHDILYLAEFKHMIVMYNGIQASQLSKTDFFLVRNL